MQMAYGALQYKQQDVESASPVRLVVMAYDMAIRACDQKDFETGYKAVVALRNSLDVDYPEFVSGLLNLYQWVIDSMRSREFDSAKSVLLELRDSWATIEKRLNGMDEERANMYQENEYAVKSV
ncbi:MAG: flagellar protein FliS [Anaerolineaceae bacterium]|nr:flagellar protein FliS [Anaerolineaceae bacterium]